MQYKLNSAVGKDLREVLKKVEEQLDTFLDLGYFPLGSVVMQKLSNEEWYVCLPMVK